MQCAVVETGENDQKVMPEQTQERETGITPNF